MTTVSRDQRRGEADGTMKHLYWGWNGKFGAKLLINLLICNRHGRGLTVCGQWVPGTALSAQIADVDCAACRSKAEAETITAER